MVSKTPSKLVNTCLIPESQHLIPFSPEPFITNPIAWMECVLPSVQLYDHFLFEVHKIHNITANWLLTTKLETFYLSVSQVPPQMSLCIRRVFPEPSCYARQTFLTPTLFPPPSRGRVFLVFPYIPERFFIELLTISI